MKRRTLDLIFAVGGLCIAGLILVLGLVLQNQANFAKDYVHDQLSQQKISFTPAQFLAADESDPCLKSNASKPLVTGNQAQCYANHYIAVHLKAINDGKTYAETSSEARALDTKLEGVAEPDQRRSEGPGRAGGSAHTARRPRCSRVRPCAVCCSPATASASSANAPSRPPTCASRSRWCCSWPRSPDSSTPPPRRPIT